jgi:3-mercaptopyruvate sulfurtransferase SseA
MMDKHADPADDFHLVILATNIRNTGNTIDVTPKGAININLGGGTGGAAGLWLQIDNRRDGDTLTGVGPTAAATDSSMHPGGWRNGTTAPSSAVLEGGGNGLQTQWTNHWGFPYIGTQGNRMPRENGVVENILSRAGVKENSHVVVMGREGSTLNARISWILHVYGVENLYYHEPGATGVSLAAWNAAYPIADHPELNDVGGNALPFIAKERFEAKYYQTGRKEASMLDVVNAINDPDWVIIDVRGANEDNIQLVGTNVYFVNGGGGWAPAQYTTEMLSYRFGAPHTLNIPGDNTSPPAHVVDIRNKNVIVHCRGGQRSATLWVYLSSQAGNILGTGTVYNWDGSGRDMIAWSRDDTNPLTEDFRNKVRMVTAPWNSNSDANGGPVGWITSMDQWTQKPTNWPVALPQNEW